MVTELAHLKCVSFLDVLVSIAVTNTLTKSNFAEERICLADNSMLQPIIAEKSQRQGLQEIVSHPVRAERNKCTHAACLLTVTIVQPAFFTPTEGRAQLVKWFCFLHSYTVQSAIRGMVLSIFRVDHPPSISNEENTPQTCSQANLI